MKNSKWMKILALAMGAALACFALAACGGGDKAADEEATGEYTLVKDGTLTVICCADFPPFEYMDGDEIKGYDAAIAREVAKRLGLEADISHMGFDSLLTQVAGGSADISISGITVRDDRKTEVDFTDAYYDSNQAIVVLADSEIATKDDLKGKAIGAQLGTSGEDWVKENVGDENYTPYQEMTEALASLRTGKVEALVFDAPVAEAYIATSYTDCKVLEVIPTGEQYAIAVSKDNPELTKAINKVLAEMEADGTMEKLSEELAI